MSGKLGRNPFMKAGNDSKSGATSGPKATPAQTAAKAQAASRAQPAVEVGPGPARIEPVRNAASFENDGTVAKAVKWAMIDVPAASILLALKTAVLVKETFFESKK